MIATISSTTWQMTGVGIGVVFSILLLIVILFFRNGLFGHREITWSAIGRRLSALAGHGSSSGEVKAHE